ncbi:MAG: enoyl-CoA hydratase/isomerase family protein [Betaproteobacteria bacterium]|nr:enoyl-CoA hydratase/isomerase family protein [Betaproteobacteria bacterium]
MPCLYSAQNRIALLTLDGPPVNSLGLAMRESLMAGLQRAFADPAVDALVLTGANGLFTGGADITEFGKPAGMQAPNLHEIVAAIEASPKPVVAAINGTCMGGGTEVSLGCHYRVAAADAMIGLPEVKLGLLPGGGGTQRLPRAGGVELALKMILGGEPVKAAVLEEAGVLDAVFADAGFVEAACAFAREVVKAGVAAGAPHPRVRDMKIKMADPAPVFAAARADAARKFARFPAPQKCIDAIEAAVTLDIDAGLKREFELFMDLMRTPESAAQRHAFFAERAAGKVNGLPKDTRPRAVNSVAVIGAGTMGGGIALNFLNAGFAVTLVETTQAALERGVANIRKVIEGAVAKGTLTAEKAQARAALLKPTLDFAAIASSDLIIEAVFEEMSVKQSVFEKLDTHAKPGAILASNTSTLDLNRIAQFTQRPQDVIGLHFFSPAHVMKLLEVVRGAATANDVLATAMAIAKKIRKTAVVSGVCDGFIGNRMIEQYARQAMFLLEEGASVEAIDGAVEAFGMAMGPFRMGDLAGNDIGWAIRKRKRAEDPSLVVSRIPDLLCEAGRFGQKTGAGWYDYKPGDRAAHPSPWVAEMLATHRKASGVPQRAIDADEIVDRLILALVNEGAQLLDEGIAQRASDIDMVYLTGYGFPLWRGGPMFHAQQTGLGKVVERMRTFAANPLADSTFWTPAPLLERLAREGKTFDAA